MSAHRQRCYTQHACAGGSAPEDTVTNSETPYMAMQQQWRRAEDRAAMYYHQLHGGRKCSNCAALRAQIAELRATIDELRSRQ